MKTSPLRIVNNTIFLEKFFDSDIEIERVFELNDKNCTISIFENGSESRVYNILPLIKGDDSIKYLHSMIRCFKNGTVMIDGVLSKSTDSHPNWNEQDYEAIRLQPFYVKRFNSENISLRGKGLFERGLHFNGVVTPSQVRSVCICDVCNYSFTIHHIHVKASKLDYLYSGDSLKTLLIDKSLELNFNKSLEINGIKFRYYNPFRCPNCSEIFIDLGAKTSIKEAEYYANYHLYDKPLEY